MSLWDMLGGAANAVGGWAKANPYAVQSLSSTLSNVGSGMVGHGNDPRAVLQGIAGAIQQGQPAQQQYAMLQQEEAARQAELAQEQEKQNATVQWLQSQGYNDLVAAVQGGADIGSMWNEGIKRANPQPNPMMQDYETRLQIGQAQGLQGNDLGNFALTGNMPGATGANPPTYGVTPIWGEDASGNPVPVQLSNQGGGQTVGLDGVTFRKDPIRLDAGTHWVLLDPVTRQPVGQIDKNVREASSEDAIGEAQGKNAMDTIANAPNDMVRTDAMLSQVDTILNDPKMPNVLGLWAALGPPIPGTEEYRVYANIEQLRSQVFLQAFEQLKGAGQITEQEGQAATRALTSFDPKMRPEDFRAALRGLRDMLVKARQRAEQRLQHAQSVVGAGTPAAGGTLSTGVNWSVVQ